MSHSRRQPITPVSVLSAVLAVGFLSACGFAQLFQAREDARQRQCSNHLKLLALATHNYHDVFNYLPPLATEEKCWTWITLLLPFMEEQRIYNDLTIHEPPTTDANQALVQRFKLKGLLCPSRRMQAVRKAGPFKGGQPTDYIAVSTTDWKRFSGETNGMIIFRAAPPTKDRSVRSRTTFGSVIDGLSNTAMLGEKHMLKDWLEGKYDEPALVAWNDQNTIRIASDVEKDNGGNDVKKLRGLATKDDKDDWKFGSQHGKVSLFALGDGSVRPVKNAAAPRVLRWFCGRNDLQPFEFP